MKRNSAGNRSEQEFRRKNSSYQTKEIGRRSPEFRNERNFVRNDFSPRRSRKRNEWRNSNKHKWKEKSSYRDPSKYKSYGISRKSSSPDRFDKQEPFQQTDRTSSNSGSGSRNSLKDRGINQSKNHRSDFRNKSYSDDRPKDRNLAGDRK